MKKVAYFFGLVGLVVVMTSTTEVTYPTVTNKAFQAGEKLRYRVTYGFMDAGEAVLEVKTTTKKGANRELLQATGTPPYGSISCTCGCHRKRGGGKILQ